MKIFRSIKKVRPLVLGLALLLPSWFLHAQQVIKFKNGQEEMPDGTATDRFDWMVDLLRTIGFKKLRIYATEAALIITRHQLLFEFFTLMENL